MNMGQINKYLLSKLKNGLSFLFQHAFSYKIIIIGTARRVYREIAYMKTISVFFIQTNIHHQIGDFDWRENYLTLLNYWVLLFRSG